MASPESPIPQQDVLPGLQSELGISKDSTSVRTDHVENLTATEREFDVYSVQEVGIRLGFLTPDNATETMKQWTRDHGFLYGNDAMTAIEHIIVDSELDEERKARFEAEYGVPFSIENVFQKGFGGVNLNEAVMDLPRTAEDERLDAEAWKKVEESRKAFDEELRRAYYEESGETDIFDSKSIDN